MSSSAPGPLLPMIAASGYSSSNASYAPGGYRVIDPQQPSFEVLEQSVITNSRAQQSSSTTSLNSSFGLSVFRLDQPQPSN